MGDTRASAAHSPTADAASRQADHVSRDQGTRPSANGDGIRAVHRNRWGVILYEEGAEQPEDTTSERRLAPP
jgi:hypothetical protein